MQYAPLSKSIINLEKDKLNWVSLVLISAIWSDKIYHEKEKAFFVFYLNEVYGDDVKKDEFLKLLERKKMEVSELPFPSLNQDFTNLESVEILDLVLQVLTIDKEFLKVEQDFFLYIGKYLRFLNHTLLKDLLHLQIKNIETKDISSLKEEVELLKKQISKTRANIPEIQKSVQL